MKKQMPKTPFATRLSGSAKETQLRLRSIFQWKKQRPPVWLFAAIVVVMFGCLGLVSCQPEKPEEPAEPNTPGEEDASGDKYDDFFANYQDEFQDFTYTGGTSYTNDDRVLILRDVPENPVEQLLFANYFFTFDFEFEGLRGLQGSENLQMSAKSEAKNAAEGLYFQNMTIYEFDALSKEDFAPGGKYFSNSKQAFEFVDQMNYLKDEYGLVEYAVVYADLSWRWSEKALELGPQLGNGRYERLYLVGKIAEYSNWHLYECFWGEQVLERTLPENTVEFLPEGKQLIVDYFQQWYDRAYFLGEEPGAPQEGDWRIDSVRFLGSEVTFETTGEAYLVRSSIYNTRMESAESEPVTKWWPVEQESYFVLGRAMDGELENVRGERHEVGHSISRMILEESYGVTDWEVTLWHDDNPYLQPLSLGWWSDTPLWQVKGDPVIERLENWEPIHWEGDYWERYTLEGLSILRRYSSMADENNYVINNIELTRDDFSTQRGIRVGSTRDEVKAAYPELKSGDYWTKYPGEDYLWYCEDELDFGPALIFFFENDKVCKIILNNMFN